MSRPLQRFALLCGASAAVAIGGASAAVAGEIILSPSQDGGAVSAATAGEQRDRARGYRKNQSPDAGTSIILVPEEEEEGMLSPRGGVESSRAAENRLRAKQLRQSEDGHGLPAIIMPGAGGDDASAHERAQESRLKARAYREHGQSATDKVGPDGIPLVLCPSTDNVAGRIGDDARSGGLIYIIRDGKSIKARCR